MAFTYVKEISHMNEPQHGSCYDRHVPQGSTSLSLLSFPVTKCTAGSVMAKDVLHLTARPPVCLRDGNDKVPGLQGEGRTDSIVAYSVKN